jgi:hypothetical protein
MMLLLLYVSSSDFAFIPTRDQSHVCQPPSGTCVMLLEVVGARELMNTCARSQLPAHFIL